MSSTEEIASCSYLIVGAGAAALAFIDTLLSLRGLDTSISAQHPIVLLDRHSGPGGHWNDAYDFARLHQPSLVYGVASKQLEGHWFSNNLLKGRLPWNHRASKAQLLKYYREVVAAWEQQGLVRFIGEVDFHFEKNAEAASASFSKLDGAKSFTINKICEKTVNATLQENIVPSKHPPQFESTSPEINEKIYTPNQVFSQIESLAALPGDTKFVVLGCGKTAMDTVVFLQETGKVPASQIRWVLPNDVWMLCREKLGQPGVLSEIQLDAMVAAGDGDYQKVGDASLDQMEREGMIKRLDAEVRPVAFRFPITDEKELALMRKKDLTKYRSGRVTSLKLNSSSEVLMLLSKKNDGPVNLGSVDKVIFVHCTSPGPFNGSFSVGTKLYSGSKCMNLFPVQPPPMPLSYSILARVESLRRTQQLKPALTKIFNGDPHFSSDEAALSELIRPGLPAPMGFDPPRPGPALASPDLPLWLVPTWNSAVLHSLVGNQSHLKFLKSNRLASASPGTKVPVVEGAEKLLRVMERGHVSAETNGVGGEGDLEKLRRMLEMLEEDGLRLMNCY